MSRDIKFRAWLPAIKKMTYAHTIEELMAWSNGKSVEAKTATWLQYTGLKDKNGVEIYEGDIVKGKFFSEGAKLHKRIIGAVEYAGTSFRVLGVNRYDGWPCELNCLFEVIGNIYENPDLLGGDAK